MKKYVNDYLKHHRLYQGDIVSCEICGYQDYIENMNLHHKIYRSKGGTDDPDNLQILCFDCHYKIHNG